MNNNQEMTSFTHTSLALYQYMCLHIVGTEKTVKTKRLLTTAINATNYHDAKKIIISGSFGEGLEMNGSDIDVMAVLPYVTIYETCDNNTFDSKTINYVMDMNDTKPGFTKLRLISTDSTFCVRKGSELYLSNYLIKSLMFGKMATVIHGPCLTDERGIFDIAICVHCKSWIMPALEWIHRAQNEWPSDSIQSYVVDRGVLFVPIGVKGSDNEELEWRISFSVGEKLLTYSFNHTQLLCYALMKILLKDVIEKDKRCKNLLSSYVLKTIIFWVSEELPLSVWQPSNLIPCFLRCFDRLIFCVKHSTCPHYFIPENNLFENAINRIEWPILIENLNIIRSYGWECLLMSEQLPQFVLSTRIGITFHQSFEEYVQQIWFTKIKVMGFDCLDYKKAIRAIISHRSYTAKCCFVYAMSVSFYDLALSLPLSEKNRNKDSYKHYNTCMSHLLLSINRDAFSSWMMLAALFYKFKQYRLSLNIISYLLSLYTPETRTYGTLLRTFKAKGLGYLSVLCNTNSQIIPNELAIEVQNDLPVFLFPPLTFAHFLRVLCYYHLGDVRHCHYSSRDFYIITAAEHYFCKEVYKVMAFDLLGVVCKLTGDSEYAKLAFLNAVRLGPECKSAVQHLHKMDTQTKLD